MKLPWTPLLLALPTSPPTSSRTPLERCLSTHSIPFAPPSSPSYAPLTNPYNHRLPYLPAAIILPTNTHQISTALHCATSHHTRVAVRSGGHSYASHSLGGTNTSLILDLRHFASISLSPSTAIASIGPGARLGPIALTLAAAGRALPHGLCSTVGLGGHATHGGFGFTSRMWGTTLDTIVAMTAITATGTVLHDITASSHADLFWALRGAGDSFGVVTEFRLATHAAPENGVRFTYDFSPLLGDAAAQAAVFAAVQRFAVEEAPPEMALRVQQGFGAYQVTGVFWGTRSHFDRTIAPLLSLLPTPPATATVIEGGWLDCLVAFNDNTPLNDTTLIDTGDTFYTKSLTTPRAFPLSSLTTFFRHLSTAVPPAPVEYWAIFDLYGGAGSVLAHNFSLDSASYGGRDALWTVQLYSHTPKQEAYPEAGIKFMGGVWESLAGEMEREGGAGSVGAYVNYVDPAMGPKEAHRRYYGGGYGRLVELKRKWDGGGVLWNPQAVGVGDGVWDE
ncbi:hypothetical protein EDC01DRAFT_478425 [Geopyxis carbonaria]|nr:hypothetical protein EDC01DRAFT_478425 [Geopyxis carbonaria]